MAPQTVITVALKSFLLRKREEEIREEVRNHILITMAQRRDMLCWFLYSDNLRLVHLVEQD